MVHQLDLSAAGSSQLLPVTPLLGVLMAVLLAAAVAVAGWGKLGHGRSVLKAGVRAVVQLVAVSLVITGVVHSLWLTALFVLLMFTVAVRTAGRRMTEAPGWSWAWAAAPIGAGVLPLLALLLGTRLLPWQGLSIVPVAGILIGGGLTATSLAGRRALDELTQRHGEVEAALALGFEDRDARLEICRTAAATSLVPALDQTRTVGLVTLPGAFVGMLLGGASPVAAGAVQLFVLVALLAVEAVAIVVVLELVGRGLVRRPVDWRG
ncbi:putative ABC transport system permease protein [Kitasatospora sp. GP30]|nr:putative ABC transport system permease protein [Kitasatospora sp. GP30]